VVYLCTTPTVQILPHKCFPTPPSLERTAVAAEVAKVGRARDDLALAERREVMLRRVRALHGTDRPERVARPALRHSHTPRQMALACDRKPSFGCPTHRRRHLWLYSCEAR